MAHLKTISGSSPTAAGRWPGLRGKAIAAVAVGALLAWLPLTGALAAAIPGDLSISGALTFDGVNSFVDGGATQSGSMTATAGGVLTTTTYSDTTTTGDDPLAASFSQTGDGVSIDGTASAPAEGDEFLAGIDFTIDLANGSATDTYQIVIGISFDNSAQAGPGDDAYAESEFTLDQPDGTEVFFTQVLSDTFFGDELNGSVLGSSGALIVDTGVTSLTIELAPGDATDLVGAFTMEGGVFDPDSTASVDFSVALTIDAIRNITTPPEPEPNPAPLPATLLLLGSGLIGLGWWRRRLH